MNSIIRAMTEKEKPCVLEMMRAFYASPAVLSNGSDDIFSNDIENCLNDNPCLEGYLIENAKKELQGYAMIAKSFSTEFGRPCIWLEDLYIKEQYRGSGIGTQFLTFITDKYPDCIFRLEVEEENRPAVQLYKQFGFTDLPYMEMKK